MARGFTDCHCHLPANEFTQAGVRALVAVTEGSSLRKIFTCQKAILGLCSLVLGFIPFRDQGKTCIVSRFRSWSHSFPCSQNTQMILWQSGR
ncbi:putative deoxyribonuclease tatdn3 [Cyprinus carpio]|uniref:Deoxyribonuclease tatdn3 n=1 Tax=Cyprinus carpio TaxID=7962 RepID=A0A9R0BGE8_CYPCA|nr:putative deoxyribonuclease tatdn3 [Cyprinus carpio]